jgi:hypothetical protein
MMMRSTKLVLHSVVFGVNFCDNSQNGNDPIGGFDLARLAYKLLYFWLPYLIISIEI